MFTVGAWSESQDSATLVNVAALADPHLRVQGDDIIVPRALPRLMGAYAVGPNLTRVRFDSPRLRRFNYQELRPLDLAAVPPSPYSLHDWTSAPIELDPEEQLNAQAAEDAAGASSATVVGLFTDRAPAPVSGDWRTIRFTNTSTLTANAWRNGALTAAETLPAGRYQVGGMRAESTNMQFARLVFVGGLWRPGCVGVQAASDLEHELFRFGRLGVWGEFEHNTPPSVDFLANGADSSQVVYLDLLKVS